MSADLTARIRGAIEEGVSALGAGGDPVSIALEVPPKPELGDLACPVAFELARRLKRAPREIAANLKTRIEGLEGIARVDVAGGGYLNVYFDRDRFLRALAEEVGRPRQPRTIGKRIIEHTNINPNKAAHIGHLRNAVLGDTLVRCLRFLGEPVEVQNYIDDTGVQVADLVVGFHAIRGLDLAAVKDLAERCARGETWSGKVGRFTAGPAPLEGVLVPIKMHQRWKGPFDAYAWDLYAEVAPYYAASPDHAAKRGAALKEMEEGHGPLAELAAFVARSMVLHHLRTMERIDVHYDLLPRESDILALRFWERAFERLKERGAVRYSTRGKTQGCWVMDLPDAAGEGETSEDDAKIIVRSNGTVTYVGKDIAYQMWKFGLLGQDFLYERLDRSALGACGDAGGAQLDDHPRGTVWSTCSRGGETDHPDFGRAARVYNVIDVRQSYLQRVVAQGLLALGYEREARESIHFYYEMVALTPKTAQHLTPGLALDAEDLARPYLEMSGRRGIGVKADDLIDGLIRRAGEEIAARRTDELQDARRETAEAIAVGALRYYMLRFTRNRVVAFDLDDALSFEGETGPYLQYATVRSRNIFNKLGDREGFDRADAAGAIARSRFDALEPADALEHWQIVREIARLHEFVEQAVTSLELSVLARYVFGVSQRFSSFYHRYPILHETDPARRDLRVALNEIYLRFMERALGLMGVPIPAWM